MNGYLERKVKNDSELRIKGSKGPELYSKITETVLNYPCLLFKGRRNRIVTLKNNLKTSAVEYFIINSYHYCVNFTKMN